MKNVSKKITPYFYILPAAILIISIYIYPIIKIINDSFYKIYGNSREFVGIENFKFLIFGNDLIKQAFINNMTLLIAIPIFLFLAVSISFILFQIIKKYKIYQYIFFIPVILSIAVAGAVFRYILRLDGVLNTIFSFLKLDFLINNWLGNPKIAIFAVISVIIWKEFGFGVILFLSKLESLPQEVFEAAKVDGANTIQVFFKITLPMLKSLISFYSIYLFVTMFAWTFSYIYILTFGGPGDSTTTFEISIYRYLILKNQPGIASALTVLLFLIVIIFVIFQSRLRITSEN